MRTSIFYTLLAWFALICMQVNAQKLTTIYSGEKNPAEEGWMELKMDETVSPAAGTVSQEIADGVLKLRSTNAADQFTQLGWYQTGLQLRLQMGYTIEIKAKVTDASKYGAFNIQGFDNMGKGFRIGIYKDYLTEWTNPLAATNVLKSGLANDDDFHIYRIAVDPSSVATLYRDGEEMGTFRLSDFYFDNLLENGGFEDGSDDFDNAAFFPDFQSQGSLYRIDEPDMTNEEKDAAGFVQVNFVRTGKYALAVNNDGKVEINDPDAFDPAKSEGARTREIPVKPNTKYDFSFSRSRILERSGDHTWAWRDMGVFYDFQEGTLTGKDLRDDNAIWAGANDHYWQTHNQTITTPAEDADRVAATMRFEFPSWHRNDDGGSDDIITSFDDFYIKENLGLEVGSDMGRMQDPVFPDNFVNLIINGDFEDWETNNDGEPYEWALSDPGDDRSNHPVDFNPLWNAPVRIQRNDKTDEDGRQWAHSGISSMRFSTLDNNDNKTFAFEKELEAGKSYRFNFWHRNPQWGEDAWLNVKIGDKVIWDNRLGRDNQSWANADITFTTTNENKTLHLYLDRYCCGWYNFYLDDLVLYEIENLEDPLLAGKTNLIINGDFEDDMIDNEGNDYLWALASELAGDDDNYPVAWSNVWGTYVRLQDKQKVHDTGAAWAHSGTNSLRISYLDNEGAAIDFGLPEAFRTNINFVKELEPNKTYTFVFWIKTANYPDRGDLMIANGDELIWKETLSTKFINWSRQSVTFNTTDENHTLRMFTEWTGWYNFYLDDLFLYEEEAPVALPALSTYLFFGKSMGTQSAEVDIEYVAVSNEGAFEPTGIKTVNAAPANIKVKSLNGELQLSVQSPAAVQIFTVTGMRVAQLNVEKAASIALPQGIYIVKSVAGGMTETVKVINN